MHHSSTSTYAPNFTEIKETLSTYRRADGRLRPTLLGWLGGVDLKMVYVSVCVCVCVCVSVCVLCIIRCNDAASRPRKEHVPKRTRPSSSYSPSSLNSPNYDSGFEHLESSYKTLPASHPATSGTVSLFLSSITFGIIRPHRSQCQCQSWIYIAHKRKASNALVR